MNNRSHDIDEVFEKYYEIKEEKSLLEEKLKEYKEIIEDLFNEFDTDVIKSHKYTAKMNKNTCTRILKKDLPQNIIDEYSTSVTTQTLQVYKTSDGKPVRKTKNSFTSFKNKTKNTGTKNRIRSPKRVSFEISKDKLKNKYIK
jgi:hypothetical protein